MKIRKSHLEAIKMMVYTDMTQTEIADELEITRKCLYNWRQDKDFKEAYEEELENKVTMVRNTFKKDSDKVYEELVKIVFDEEAQDKDKIAIGKYILDHAVGKSAETINMESKVIMDNVSDTDILSVFDKDK